MEMMLWRDTFTDKSSEGKLLVDGIFECFTLEDVTRPAGAPKIFGQTAIPYGTYDVIIAYSPHFNRQMPHLLNVPNFSGILIHYGNRPADTEGCILVGRDKGDDFIGSSVLAFDALYSKISDALAEVGGKVQITIAPFSYDSQAGGLTKDAIP